MNDPGRVLVVGAGPTGLGAAWRLEELGCRDWQLLEAAATPGGLAASFVDDKGFTWDVGAAASLTALSNVTITGRFYFDIWSDRHCPEIKTGGTGGFDGDPIAVCEQYRAGSLTADEQMRVNKLTTGDENTPWQFTERESGIRLMASVIAEVAVEQRWSVFGILEGAPFQNERALFTSDFSHSMPSDSDFNLYLRLGLTYKF